MRPSRLFTDAGMFLVINKAEGMWEEFLWHARGVWREVLKLPLTKVAQSGRPQFRLEESLGAVG